MNKRFLSVVSAAMLALVIGLTVPNDSTVLAAGYTSAVQSCVISADRANVTLTANISAGQASDDNALYLFEQPTYGTGLSGNPVATAPMAGTASFTFPLNHKQANTRLYSKFAVAVKSGGSFVQIAEGNYITNPEVLAENTLPVAVASSKKGLQVSPTQFHSGEIADIGAKYVTYDIPINRLIGPTTNGSYPTINFNYNGKNYQFDGFVVGQYDYVFQTLTSQGAIVTALLLNEFDPTCLQTTHPLARVKTVASYNMFNAAESVGVDYLSAAAAFLAQRYSSDTYGKVQNWVIGNEITARSDWNYITPMDVTTYTEEYAKALRVFYTAIKSTNANANIYISLDQTWNRNLTTGTGYDGRDIIDALSANSIAKGNYNWGVAFHPYPVPLTWPKFWGMPAQYKSMNLVSYSESTPMVTPQNICVVTDYMCKPQNLAANGQVRSLIISEVGFTSSLGEDVQAAALAYAYYNAANNQHIDAFIVARDIDFAAEVAQGLPLGLRNIDGTYKKAYNVYKYIDTDQSLAVTNPYLGIVGISNWNQVVQAR